MSLIEVRPEVQTLSRLDKSRLIQLLAQELERDADAVDTFLAPVSNLASQALGGYHLQ